MTDDWGPKVRPCQFTVTESLVKLMSVGEGEIALGINRHQGNAGILSNVGQHPAVERRREPSIRYAGIEIDDDLGVVHRHRIGATYSGFRLKVERGTRHDPSAVIEHHGR
jgi:hypothetical protein